MPELVPGQVLDGRYRITARIARGGMATVYEALDTRLHRDVAVKVMHATLARDEEFVDRFIREARSAARLSHPNVVAVFDQGSQPDPRTGEDCVYLVMELVRGRTLRQILRERGPLPPTDALAVLEPVLAALRAAHDAGIVHRDVKPENILLADDGRVEVADFGLARAVNSASGHTMTRGVLLGTVSYLAPEQVLDGSADARTDVYAAGIVLFEMLTGTKPHDGDSPIAVAYKHVNDDVPRPSALHPGIPPAVDRLVRRATDRNADQRFADGREFLAAVRTTRELLRRHPDRPPVAARQPTAAPPNGRPSNGRPPNGRPAAGADTPRAPHSTTDPGFLAGGTVRPAPTTQPARPALGHAAGQPPRPAVGPVSGDTTSLSLARPGPVPRGATRLSAAAPVATSTGQLAGWAPDRSGPYPTGHGAAFAEPGAGGGAVSEAVSARADLAIQRRRTLARRRRRRGIAAVIIVLVVAVLVGAVAWYVGDGRFADVPRLSGLPEAQAEQVAESAGLHLQVAAQRWDDTTPAGYVITASDPAQERVPRGTTVGVVVSRGAQRHILPTLVGLTEASAIAKVRAQTLTVGPVRGVWDPAHPAGQVIASDPTAGDSLKRGTPVTITVSRGPQPVTVPDVTDQVATTAVPAVSNTGVGVKLVEQASSTVPAGLVVSQSPAAGAVPPDTVVTLVVSTGPAPVQVPWSIIGASASAATARLSALGLKVEVRHSLIYVGLNRVVSAGGLAGTTVPGGSTVVLTVV